MSNAEELLREGEITGEIKGQIETIEKLLRAGVTWETVEQATGIDPRRFAEMKKELVRLGSTGIQLAGQRPRHSPLNHLDCESASGECRGRSSREIRLSRFV